MSTCDVTESAYAPAGQLRFGRYDLDLDRGCLLLDGSEIALRPKTFAVLHHFLQNPQRLVSKDELFAAVWPKLAVTDDTLVQSIGELRRALGEEGPRLLKTIPRRGYRFDADVTTVGPREQVDDAASTGIVPPEAITVARPSAIRVTNAPAAMHARSIAWFGIIVLIAAGALWSGFRSDWKVPTVPGLGDSSKGERRAPNAKPLIAVLPFANRGDDAGRDYVADGLTQDLISALGRFSAVTVMSWNAVATYKAKPATPAEIGRVLGVRYQVEGSVRQTGDRVRVAAQLVDTDGRVLWSARFEDSVTGVFALQDRIALQIAGALAVSVAESEQRRAFAKPSDNLEAYDYVLRARPALQRPTRSNIAEARALLRRAVELDPGYAAAYAALAETYVIGTAMGWAESPTTFLDRAEEMAAQALSLNPTEVRAWVVLGRVHIYYQRYEQAKTEMERAIAINPSDADGLAGRGNILVWLGETDSGIEALEHAQRIDPEPNPFDRNALALAYYLEGRYESALQQAQLNLPEPLGAHFGYALLAAAYAQQGRFDEAAAAADSLRRMDPMFDPQAFGSKLQNASDLERLRDGFRKAGLYTPPANQR